MLLILTLLVFERLCNIEVSKPSFTSMNERIAKMLSPKDNK